MPAADAVDRLQSERLEVIHQTVFKLKSERRDIPTRGPAAPFPAPRVQFQVPDAALCASSSIRTPFSFAQRETSSPRVETASFL